MKIAFLSIYYEGSNRGAETFILELSKRLGENFTIDIVSGKSKKLNNWPILWRFFLDPQGIGVLVFTVKNIIKLWKEKYEVVIPMDGGWQALLVRLLTWLYGGKVVISGQSGKGWFDRINILSCPDVFVSLSKWELGELKWMNPLVKFVCIPNGVDIDKFKSNDRKRIGSVQEKIVLAVGAFTMQKRLHLAINAVFRLNNVKLILVGSPGEMYRKLLKEGGQLLGKKFQIKSVSYDEMPEIYRSASVFTLPSDSSEAFGNVIVEAMASGLPVVVVDDPIRREIVGDAGILVEPTNITEYSKALEKAFSTDWGNKPRKQAEKFSWDKIALEYQNLFNSLFEK